MKNVPATHEATRESYVSKWEKVVENEIDTPKTMKCRKIVDPP